MDAVVSRPGLCQAGRSCANARFTAVWRNEVSQPILKGEVTMRPFALLVCSLALATGNLGFAQQSSEWRPNIAEDNKSATWEDTAAFIVGMLNSSSPEKGGVEVSGRCALLIPDWSPKPFGISFIAGTLTIASVAPNSFADAYGLKPGTHIIAVNQRKVHDISDLNEIWKNLRQGDDVVFEALQDGQSSNIFYIGGRIDKAADHNIPSAGSKRLRLDLQHVDPLSIDVVATTIRFSGTNGQTIATELNDGARGAPGVQAVAIPVGDLEIAKRLARAFMHAAFICGGTKAVSPF